MTGFDYPTAVALVFSFISIFLVIFQLHGHTEQRKIESLIQVYDINRQLLMLGFSTPELFDILQGSQNTDPVWERRYLQLWLNQMALINAIQDRGLFSAEQRESLERDMRDFLALDNMRRHWQSYRGYYPASFQTYVDSLIKTSTGAIKEKSDSALC